MEDVVTSDHVVEDFDLVLDDLGEDNTNILHHEKIETGALLFFTEKESIKISFVPKERDGWNIDKIKTSSYTHNTNKPFSGSHGNLTLPQSKEVFYGILEDDNIKNLKIQKETSSYEETATIISTKDKKLW
ncbi:hypothetical protein [Natranaerobius trueperi]|uniref:Uncharacterized protein n=1 Tax=Natranaerobius trueperi TaxID=759412 RepID=A0A226C0E5_9FIRM|nr:hypothetical protein [Natranaerobius trueperi]OWZ84064.1 hypothetical protein CDO51_04935 [Natranaerobius trueperi]